MKNILLHLILVLTIFFMLQCQSEDTSKEIFVSKNIQQKVNAFFPQKYLSTGNRAIFTNSKGEAQEFEIEQTSSIQFDSKSEYSIIGYTWVSNDLEEQIKINCDANIGDRNHLTNSSLSINCFADWINYNGRYRPIILNFQKDTIELNKRVKYFPTKEINSNQYTNLYCGHGHILIPKYEDSPDTSRFEICLKEGVGFFSLKTEDETYVFQKFLGKD